MIILNNKISFLYYKAYGQNGRLYFINIILFNNAFIFLIFINMKILLYNNNSF